MLTIFKYPLKLIDIQSVTMPARGTILSVHEQRGQLCIWALVDQEIHASVREIYIVGTGHPADHINDSTRFIGTCVTEGGSLVWHVFERFDVAKGL